MDLERAFQDLGIDAITGTQLMEMLSINVDELQSPQRFSKFREVINYFKQFSPDTQRFLINKATRGKLVDKLDHLYEYTQLLENKSKLEQSISDLDKEKSAIETTGEEILMTDVAQRRMETQKKLGLLTEEIALYE